VIGGGGGGPLKGLPWRIVGFVSRSYCCGTLGAGA
jgi:hypothetical protein